MGKPLAIDLFCGLGGWTEGLLAEGYNVVGFDIERHVYGNEKYPAQLVLQDALTIHGKQFKDAALIVASPPCQEFSYMAMPWSKAKQKRVEYLNGTRDRKQLTALFDACFRIQREASEAAGHHIPMVVENVRGAIPWVGRSRWNFGSFHLWGDVPALMPIPKTRVTKVGGIDFNDFKNGKGTSPGFNDTAIRRAPKINGVTRRLTNPAEWSEDGTKQGGDWFNAASGYSISRRTSSRSTARKRAAAVIAKIPLVLSRHIASVYRP